jgi:hypothetical protein
VTRKLLLLASALSLFAVTPVWAETITFNFADCTSITAGLGKGAACPGDLQSSGVTFTENSLQIQAGGAYVPQNLKDVTPADLYVKQGGSSSETGLGLANTVNDEINAYQGIALDLADLSQNGIYSGTVLLSSLQQGEYGTVCALGVDSLSFTDCQMVSETGYTNIGSLNVSWTASDPYLAFLGPGTVGSDSQWCDTSGGNFLIDSLTVQSPVPEPGSLALFGLGLAALGLAVAGRKRAPGR